MSATFRRLIVACSVTLLAMSMTGARAQTPRAPDVTKGTETAKPEFGSPINEVARLVDQLRQHPAPPTRKPGALALFLFDTEIEEITRIADELVQGLNFCGVIEWSRDGKRIVFDIGAAPGGREWVRTQIALVERGELRPLIRRLGSGSLPSITHDGEKILFMLHPGMEGATDSSFWIMQNDGTNRTKLEEGGRPRLSPDGRFCRISTLGGQPQYRLVDLATAVIESIQLPDRQFFSIPSWVDDETFGAMTGATRGDFISLIDLSNPKVPRVKEDLWKRSNEQTFKPRSPVYPPQTRRCYFLGREQAEQTYVYWFKKGETNPLKRFESASGNDVEGLSLAPGGRYILFSSDRPDTPAK